MPGESISFDITASGDADRKFRQVGDAALSASGKIDVAAASLKAFDNASAKSAKATDTLIKSKLAAAKADKTLADAESFISAEADKATRLLSGQGRVLEDTGAKAKNAAAGFNWLAGAGAGGIPGGGMGALIAAGVVLSPVLLTLGTGLAGLGAAAYGIAKPIEKAAQSTGGLQANMSKLNPEQQQVALGLLALGKTFGQFQHDLQPVVLADFSKGLQLAGGLLHDVEPVAAATGKALGGLLGQIDAEFKSGTWQQFFKFMAATAGPDMRLLGTAFTGLLGDLPPLVEGLQPLATGLLHVTTDAAGFVGWMEKANLALPALGATMGFFVAGPLGALVGGLAGASLELSKVHTAIDATIPSWTRNAQAVKFTSGQLSIFGPQVSHYVDWLHKSGAAGKSSAAEQQKFGAQIRGAGNNAAAAGPQFFSLNQAVAALNASEAKLIGNLLTLQGSDLSWKQSLQAAETQLKSNTAGTEGNSKAAIANKQAILGATQAAQAHADEQKNLSHNIAGASQTIQAQIRWLQNLHDKSAFVKAELAALRKEEAQLNAQRINQTINVQGLGQWSVSQSLAPGVGHRRAAGGLIPGAGNADIYPALLTPGEVVVPKGMVGAGAVDHLRGKLPGFAAGGLVPTHTGLPGMVPWIKTDDQATIRLIDQAVVKATVAGIKAAQQAATTGGFGGHGVIPKGPIQSYAQQLVGRVWPGLGEWLAFADIVNRESGWNPFATNPSSGAYGIPQALPGDKMASAGADWRTNPYTQLRWMVGYIAQRWVDPIRADFNERNAHWYDNGGILRPGLTLAYNGTGRNEMVVPNRGGGGTATVTLEVRAGGGGQFEQMFAEMIRKYVRVRGGDVQAVFGRP